MTRVIFIVTDANKSKLEDWAAGVTEDSAKLFDCVANTPLQVVGDKSETVTHWLGNASVNDKELSVLNEAISLGLLFDLKVIVDVKSELSALNLEPKGYEPEPEPIPQVISASQARVALSLSDNGSGGSLLDSVNTVISTLPDKTPIRIFWEYEHQFHRTSPGILALGAQLNLSSDQIDALFILAKSINV